MSCGKALMSFAMNDCEAIVSIDHVDRGAACGCFCPVCKERLVAKQGDVRIWHFAHASGADCAHGAETALHLAAKQVILENRILQLPALCVKASAQGIHTGRLYFGEAELAAELISFDRVILERPTGSIVPDAIGVTHEDRLLIEVAVTHFVDERKLDRIKQLDVPAVEIRLDQDRLEHWTWESLKDEVLHRTDNRTWLHQPKENSLRAIALARAEELAKSDEPAKPVELKKENAIHRRDEIHLCCQGVPVVLREYGFGLVAWSPYDENINTIYKRFGGGWQPLYRNWLLPKRIKQQLIAALQ